MALCLGYTLKYFSKEEWAVGTEVMTLHLRVPVLEVPTLFPIPAPCYCAQVMAQRLVSVPPTRQTHMEFLAPGFCLAQSLLLQALEE